ncbi:Sorting and Assembly Machinery 35kDa protein [Ectocarpus siliculosus]|uniref:Sorting and Assembly Machinery 35kDa protein n=1 Tax=Ectocarpus siliculosus TaxID=2880 RepID=D7FY19_ECTSI|nr:Sorting and Assembly Machinery 35kDa protein [Ectocarpus siliculosus]|eukprot:CBJ32432.1 Sorting and Assembly Machinery 35kDa protein [Ectocarpus siliculosus]
MASEEHGDAVPVRTSWNPLRALRSWGRIEEQPDLEQPGPVITHGSALDVMVVTQFRPAWEIQAHLRFVRLPYRVENSSYMGSAATGLYPALTDGQFVLRSEDAAGHIASRRSDVDVGLTEAEKVEAQALAMLVREGLQPLLRVMRYMGDEGEVRQTVHPPMKKALSWPLSWWSPAAEGRRSKRESAVRGLDRLSKAELIGRAKEMYAALDLRLGNSKEAFFFGSRPTSVDAVVFGHLAEAWTIAVLLDLLPAFDNLSRLFRHVCDNYFRPGSFPPPSSGGEGVAESKKSGSEDRLRDAMLRADYVNSHNAFNQLAGCALCSEVPYIEDPYPPRPIANAGIPPPVLAGDLPGVEGAQGTAAAGSTTAAAAAAEAAAGKATAANESLPVKYTVISIAAFMVLSNILSRG